MDRLLRLMKDTSVGLMLNEWMHM